jgi:hypothetical protein
MSKPRDVVVVRVSEKGTSSGPAVEQPKAPIP